MTRALGWYAAAVVSLAAAYMAVPVVRPALIGAISLTSLIAIELGIRRHQPERFAAWRLLQLCLAVLAAGDMLHLLTEGEGTTPMLYPAAPELVTLGGYLLLGAALFWLGRPTGLQREETSLIDAISLTLAASLIVWLTLVRPAVESQSLSQAGRVTAVFTMVGYIAVFAAAIRLVLGWRRSAAVIILGLALIWFLVSELRYGYQLVRDPRAWPGGWGDLGYIALAAGCGAAALTASMRDVAPPASGRHSLTPWRLAMIAAALLVAPAVLIVQTLRGQVEAGWSIASAGALVSFLVLVRLSMSGRAHQERAAREHAVRVASQAMVSAATAADVKVGTQDALRSLQPTHGPINLGMLDRPGRDRPLRTVTPVGPGRRASSLSRSAAPSPCSSSRPGPAYCSS